MGFTIESPFLLTANVDIFRLDSGEIALHCGALLTADSAQQVVNGLRAVLSGQFTHAMSEESYKFQLARTFHQPPPSTSTLKPELDML